jgi:hypothetical protein
MELAPVRPDDIVRVNKRAAPSRRSCSPKARGELEIEPIQRGITYTTASARDVICHWAKRGRPRPRQVADGGSNASGV